MNNRNKIEELKEYMRKNLPDVKLDIVDNSEIKKLQKTFTGRQTDPAGIFNKNLNKIFISKKAETDEKVLAHEIVHAYEYKKTGDTSHRNRQLWKRMEDILGVPLFTKSPSGFETLRASNIIEVLPPTSGKYCLSCSSCGWKRFYPRKCKTIIWFKTKARSFRCPKCHREIILTENNKF